VQNRTSCPVLNSGFEHSSKPITNGFSVPPCTGANGRHKWRRPFARRVLRSKTRIKIALGSHI
ncbi:hypothetical protein, partial [Treponema sp. OMZ 840]|uniref:hypothetical protein n=1 Tax=Treponema sp. OMZ 840 TaxID=244313 RepID=UPI003D915F50